MFRAEKDGSLRVLYTGWEDVKVFQPGESIELVARGGQVQAFRRGVPTDPLVAPIRNRRLRRCRPGCRCRRYRLEVMRFAGLRLMGVCL
jgi:hypothetical protein